MCALGLWAWAVWLLAGVGHAAWTANVTTVGPMAGGVMNGDWIVSSRGRNVSFFRRNPATNTWAADTVLPEGIDDNATYPNNGFGWGRTADLVYPWAVIAAGNPWNTPCWFKMFYHDGIQWLTMQYEYLGFYLSGGWTFLEGMPLVALAPPWYVQVGYPSVQIWGLDEGTGQWSLSASLPGVGTQESLWFNGTRLLMVAQGWTYSHTLREINWDPNTNSWVQAPDTRLTAVGWKGLRTLSVLNDLVLVHHGSYEQGWYYAYRRLPNGTYVLDSPLQGRAAMLDTSNNFALNGPVSDGLSYVAYNQSAVGQNNTNLDKTTLCLMRYSLDGTWATDLCLANPFANYSQGVWASLHLPRLYLGWSSPAGSEFTTAYVYTLASDPTAAPTPAPSAQPTPAPTTAAPTARPTREPTAEPTPGPTVVPGQPTPMPTTAAPTTPPTRAPTPLPTRGPTPNPTPLPGWPTAAPTLVPTARPTRLPTYAPSPWPTAAPSPAPTVGAEASVATDDSSSSRLSVGATVGIAAGAAVAALAAVAAVMVTVLRHRIRRHHARLDANT